MRNFREHGKALRDKLFATMRHAPDYPLDHDTDLPNEEAILNALLESTREAAEDDDGRPKQNPKPKVEPPRQTLPERPKATDTTTPTAQPKTLLEDSGVIRSESHTQKFYLEGRSSDSLHDDQIPGRFPPYLPPPQVRPRHSSPPVELRSSFLLPAGNPEPVEIKPPIIVKNLAALLNMKPFVLVHHLMDMGIFVSSSQEFDVESARKVCAKLGFILHILSDEIRVHKNAETLFWLRHVACAMKLALAKLRAIAPEHTEETTQGRVHALFSARMDLRFAIQYLDNAMDPANAESRIPSPFNEW